MESGTVLHLALLKKLSNHYPSGQLSSRFNEFKRSPPKYSPRSPNAFPRPFFEKYQKGGKHTALPKQQKPRRKRLQKKFDKVFEHWESNDSVTAWDIENQQQVSYTEKLKRDKYDFFPKLIENNKILKKVKNKAGGSSSLKGVLKASKVLNILENPYCQPNIIKYKGKSSEVSVCIYQEKENEPSVELLPTTFKRKSRRAKSNDRSITASPLCHRVKGSLIL